MHSLNLHFVIGTKGSDKPLKVQFNDIYQYMCHVKIISNLLYRFCKNGYTNGVSGVRKNHGFLQPQVGKDKYYSILSLIKWLMIISTKHLFQPNLVHFVQLKDHCSVFQFHSSGTAPNLVDFVQFYLIYLLFTQTSCIFHFQFI